MIQLNLLRYTKVYQAQANSSAHKVLWLQIIVDYAFIMNNLQAVSKGSYLVKGHTMHLVKGHMHGRHIMHLLKGHTTGKLEKWKLVQI